MIEPYAFEKRSREEIDAEINKRIKYTVHLAYNHSPFYRSKFDILGIKPSEIVDSSSLSASIRKGLRLTKDELLREFDRVITDYSSGLSITEVWSSGTSGAPKRVWYAPDDLRRSYDQVKLAYRAMNLSRGDYVINMFSPPPNSSGPLAQAAGLDMGLHMLQIATPMKTDRLLQIIKICKPKSLFAISTRMNQVPEEIEQVGEKASNLGLKNLFTGGEPYSKEKKESIEKDWGDIPVTDVWASAEASVMGYMSDNCNKFGLHIPENRLLIDAVDPDTLEPVGTGNVGIDLVSTLYNIGEKPATILLGYSHNDSIRIRDVDRCNCGRTYKMIEWPLIRREDIVHVAGQNINFRLGVESAISNIYPFLTEEYLTIYKPIDVNRRRPYLEIRIETKKPVSDISEDERRDVEHRVWSYVISNPAAESIIFSQSETKIQFMERGKLFEGCEQYYKPGKPIRLIKM